MTPNVPSNSDSTTLRKHSTTDLKINKLLPRTKRSKVKFSKKGWQPRITISEAISVSLNSFFLTKMGNEWT